MDLASIRARLPSMTRAAFGAAVTIYPMRSGKLGAASLDPNRSAQVGVMGRFDIAPELEQIGGGRERPQVSRAMTDHVTISFALSDLLWPPRQSDEIERLAAGSDAPERYRIDRTAASLPGIILCYLSRL